MSSNPFDDVADDAPPQQPADLSIGNLLSAGIRFLTSTTGLQIFGLLVVVALINQVVSASSLVQFFTAFEEAGVDIPDAGEPPSALVLDLPGPVVSAIPILLGVVVQTAKVIAVRSFAADELDGIHSETATRRLGVAVGIAFIGGVILTIAQFVGVLGFGIGLLITYPLVWVLFVFYLQEVSIRDRGLFEGMSESLDLTDGHRATILGLGVIFAVIGGVVAIVTTVGLLFIPWTAYAGVSAVLSGIVTVFSLGAVTQAWVELDHHREEQVGPMSADNLADDQGDSWQETDEWTDEDSETGGQQDDQWNSDDDGWS